MGVAVQKIERELPRDGHLDTMTPCTARTMERQRKLLVASPEALFRPVPD
ncbi:hypothetical protein SPHFLASMR4Y_00331 [Sphingorhabdus sp. SMR4y]|nr:hypothetical protein SPHFLASMR4Y_00331 [Sphingorhabdus sp. SMR4y]